MSKISALFRLGRAGWVLAREGVIAALPADGLTGLPAFGHRIAKRLARRRVRGRSRADRISLAMNKLGPSYVKLGQFLATRPDIVGQDIAKDLTLLQDRLDFFPQQQSVQQIEGSLGRKIDNLFVEFDPPIAAASMAQVHPAWVEQADGSKRKVAVKVIRPGVRQRFARDLNSFFLVAEMQERYVPASRRLRPVTIVETLAQTTRLEMDLRLEAAALSEMNENSREDKGFRVPQVDWERTGRDVLTIEWIDGTKMSDIEGLKKQGFDTHQLAVTLMQSFLSHTLRDGFFHADMHPGNLFVDPKGEIVAVDFGITGRLGKKERRFLAEILYGFITRNYQRVAEVHFEAGYVPHRHSIPSFAQAIRAIGEPIHGQSAQTISMAKLLTLLFEVTELFDMETRPELLLLQKTMVVVEGVARTLDPHFNMWEAAEPVVGRYIRENLGPVGLMQDGAESLKALITMSRRIPEYTKRFERFSQKLDNLQSLDMHLDDSSIHKLIKAQKKAQQGQKYALWVIALSCIALIAIII